MKCWVSQELISMLAFCIWGINGKCGRNDWARQRQLISEDWDLNDESGNMEDIGDLEENSFGGMVEMKGNWNKLEEHEERNQRW